MSNCRLQMVCSVPRRLMAALHYQFSVPPPRFPCEGSLEVGGAHVHVDVLVGALRVSQRGMLLMQEGPCPPLASRRR